MRNKINFLIQGVKNFREIGTITRSGPVLCKKMIEAFPSDQDIVVVELGAGDGVITRHLLKKLTPNSKVLSIELNEKLHEELSKIDDPRLLPINGNIDDLEKILQENGISEIDHMVSAIPFILFPKEHTIDFLQTAVKLIKNGGKYVQLHYAKRMLPLYRSVFGNAKLHFVFPNVPPAFVIECEIMK